MGTVNVAFCIFEILGMMYAVGIAIDSVSVINIVLAVGLSVDYSAHVGHCFMMKAGGSRNDRVTDALADIGAAVLSGATSTFLAVAVLLGSSSYVFQTLSVQFAITVALGITHGLILLPVLLSLIGPHRPFRSAIKSSTAFNKAEAEQEETYHNNRSNNENDTSDDANDDQVIVPLHTGEQKETQQAMTSEATKPFEHDRTESEISL